MSLRTIESVKPASFENDVECFCDQRNEPNEAPLTTLHNSEDVW
jgi:hypothetical protein